MQYRRLTQFNAAGRAYIAFHQAVNQYILGLDVRLMRAFGPSVSRLWGSEILPSSTPSSDTSSLDDIWPYRNRLPNDGWTIWLHASVFSWTESFVLARTIPTP